MKCIFCLEERPPSVEHVFPLAIGGGLKTDRICESCNSTLGSRVDAALNDSFAVRARRSDLGLAGNSGKVPPFYELLIGKHKLAADRERHVKLTFDEATGKLDMRALHHASNVIMPDGTKVRRIIVDARDKSEIPKIIQRERKRHGLPPLSEEQIVAEVEKAAQNSVTVENPQLLIELSANFAYVRHALVKIAYELAFLWLGEPYLDDPSAAELRMAICDPDIASTNGIPGYIGDAGGCEVLKIWAADKTHHLALANALADEQGIVIAVRIFDIHAAVIRVTKDAARYLSGPDANTKLRFLAIEPKSGNMLDVPLMQELDRIASLMVESQRAGLSGTMADSKLPNEP
jgi:hypothetical protein